MNKKEKQLFKCLCEFKKNEIDKNLIAFASPCVLGHLFFNRMQGIAYGNLRLNNMLENVNREFRNSLAAAYEQNVKKNQSFMICVKMISEILSECNCKAAMLKGAYLSLHYPDGYRTSNDIDILVSPQNVTEIGILLTKYGFKQGNIRNGEFVTASRQEIIESKMMRGETVPYIKEVNLPFMKFLEVDINFSLDYKSGDKNLLENILSKVCLKNEKGICVPTLDSTDFFIHLCAHLYKEATTLPWIQMKRDMTLYKYCDIYLLISEMSTDEMIKIFDRAKELGMEKICAYTISETMDLFDMNLPQLKITVDRVLNGTEHFLVKVVAPKEKKVYHYKTQSASERFFMSDRILDLEVQFDENT